MNALVTWDSKQCFQICWNSKDLKIFQVELQNSKLFLEKKILNINSVVVSMHMP